MATKALVQPSLLINGQVVNIVPNSLEITKGTGTKNVKTQSTGGGNTNNVVFDDLSARVSVLKFKIFNTVANMDFIDSIVESDIGNLVQYINAQGQSGSISGAVVTNDPNYALGVDGETEIEMKGEKVKS